MTCYVYRLYSLDNELLYIGMSINPEQRVEQHRSKKGRPEPIAFYKTEEYPTRSEAAAAEKEAILAAQPKYNVVHGPAEKLIRKPDARQPITVSLDQELLRRIEGRARRFRSTVSDVIRSVLQAEFAPELPRIRLWDDRPASADAPGLKFRRQTPPSAERKAEATALVRRAYGVPEMAYPVDF